MINKKWLIAEFYNLKGNNPDEVEELIAEIENYLEKNKPDVQLQLLLCSLKAHRDDLNNVDTLKICEAITPVISTLQDIEWGLLEVDILSMSLKYIKPYQVMIEMFDKAIALLDGKYAKDEETIGRKLHLYFNASYGAIREKFYERINPAELRKFFTHCINEAIAICDEKGLTTYRLVLLIRQAIFYQDADKIVEHMNALRTTKDKAWIKTTSDEIVEYCRSMSRKMTTALYNLMLGHLIKKRREEIGMTKREFARAIGAITTTVDGFERGFRGVLAKRLSIIAEVLGVDKSYFTSGDILLKTTASSVKGIEAGLLVDAMTEEGQDASIAALKELAKLYKK